MKPTLIARLFVAALAGVAMVLMFGCARGGRTVRFPRPSPPVVRGPIRF